MTIEKVIKLALQHADNGNVQGAIRILESSIRAAGSARAIRQFQAALFRIAGDS
jgi:hypothetical protein